MKIRRQHYVWRYYLKQWCYKKEQIFCLRNASIFSSNLMGVANERDFYRLNELNDDDIYYIEQIAIKDSPEVLKGIHRRWIYILTLPFKIKSNLIEQGYNDPIMFDKIENDTEEMIYGHIESSSIKYLNKLYNNDVSFYMQEDDNMNFNYYLFEQYMRTNKRKQFINRIDRRGKLIDIEKIWNIIRHIYATNIAYNLSMRKEEFNIVMLANITDQEFITSDQPVINTHADEKMQGKPVTDFELYYPIMPSKGILITKDTKYSSIKSCEVTIADVKRYNNLIIVNSHNQLFANKRETLEVLNRK